MPTRGSWGGGGGVAAAVPAATGELEYAANITGNLTALPTSGTTDIPGCAVTVAPTAAPLWLHVGAVLAQTALGTGSAFVSIYETTGGGNVWLESFMANLPNDTGNTAAYLQISGAYRVGPTTTTRTFKLAGVVNVASGAPGASVINSSTSPSFLLAEAK